MTNILYLDAFWTGEKTSFEKIFGFDTVFKASTSSAGSISTPLVSSTLITTSETPPDEIDNGVVANKDNGDDIGIEANKDNGDGSIAAKTRKRIRWTAWPVNGLKQS